MKTKAKRLIIPICTIIADLGETVPVIFTDYEIKITNAYFYFLETQKVAEQLQDNECYVIKTISTALRKINFLCGLPSKQKFLRGELTRKQFLNAPISFHNFSTRLYHVLKSADVFNLNEIIQIGAKELSHKRGFGDKALLEILNVLEKKRCGHLLRE